MQNLPFCTSLLLWGHTFPQRSLGQTEQSGERERRKKEKKTCPLNVTILKHEHVDTVQNDFQFQWMTGNSILNTPRSRGFHDCLWHKQATAGHYRSPCPENHVWAHTKMPIATLHRKRPEWNLHSLVKDHKAFQCCWDTSYLAINYRRKLIDDSQRLQVNCRGLMNNCVETKDRIKGDQLCSDLTGSVGEVGNMKIMWC